MFLEFDIGLSHENRGPPFQRFYAFIFEGGRLANDLLTKEETLLDSSPLSVPSASNPKRLNHITHFNKED